MSSSDGGYGVWRRHDRDKSPDSDSAEEPGAVVLAVAMVVRLNRSLKRHQKEEFLWKLYPSESVLLEFEMSLCAEQQRTLNASRIVYVDEILNEKRDERRVNERLIWEKKLIKEKRGKSMNDWLNDGQLAVLIRTQSNIRSQIRGAYRVCRWISLVFHV